LLESEINGARATYDAVVEDRLRKVVRKDDILDSIALAIAARHDELATTPSDPGDNEPRIYYPPTEIPELE
jgi:predicted RNase H-like nuclease